MHTLKDILAGKCEKWAAATRQNNGKTVIDISKEFQEIFTRNILTITLGEDISEELVEINVIGDGKEFKLKKVKFNQALRECSKQLARSLPAKILNPLYLLGLISFKPNLTPFQKKVANNCKVVR